MDIKHTALLHAAGSPGRHEGCIFSAAPKKPISQPPSSCTIPQEQIHMMAAVNAFPAMSVVCPLGV